MRNLGPETSKGYAFRLKSGFIDKYLSGQSILDIGFKGGALHAEPITANAIGVELDYPGYDGRSLPFGNDSQDAVFVSHCLEHIPDYKQAISEWYRVLRIGGYLIIAVPHQYLYERKVSLPSIFNGDHKRFYTPQSLLREIDESIPIDGYRLRSLRDNDDGFNYELAPTQHAEGMYEIELVLEKIKRPEYGSRLSWQKIVELTTTRAVAVIEEMLKCEDENKIADLEILDAILSQSVLPNYILIRSLLPDVHEVRLKALLSKYISTVPFDAAWYLQKYPDLARSGAQTLDSALSHFVKHGYFEGRQGSAAYSELGLRK